MIWIMLLLASLMATPVFAQNHQTFQIARPVAIGAAGTGLDADNRIYRAYTGIPYEIHADAVGGSWPYTYSLSNAPAGMTIEAGPCTVIGPTCTAGTITWPNPTSTASNITVTIRDKDGDQVTGTWSITVSTTIGANGFCFLSPSGNDSTGNGSLTTPYQTLSKAADSCGAHSILYLRAGTYVTTGIAGATSPDEGSDCNITTTWSETSRPIIWLGYPGETAVVNFGSAGGMVECIMTQGENTWLDHLELANIGSIGFKFNIRNGFGVVARNLNAHDLLHGASGNNSSFLMWTRCDDCPSYFDTVQVSYFDDVTTHGCALKLYGIQYGLFETSAYSTSTSTEAILAIKGTVPHYTVRGNTFDADTLVAIGGNMATAGQPTGGEIYHNFCLSTGIDNGEGCITLVFAEVNPSAEVWVYRNTFLGHVVFAWGSTGDGPYNFNDNVILNNVAASGSCPQYITCYGPPTDYTVLVLNADNVFGANNGTIANATTGALVGASRTTYLGVAGFELADVTIGRLSGGLRLNGNIRVP